MIRIELGCKECQKQGKYVELECSLINQCKMHYDFVSTCPECKTVLMFSVWIDVKTPKDLGGKP